jgi:hypothetical protein
MKGEVKQADYYFSLALELSPEDAGIRLNLERAEWSLGRGDRPLATGEEAVDGFKGLAARITRTASTGSNRASAKTAELREALMFSLSTEAPPRQVLRLWPMNSTTARCSSLPRSSMWQVTSATGH